MKWNEIPKFKEFGIINPINFGFVSYVDFVNEQVKNYDLQLNPEFQRGHIWTLEQQENISNLFFVVENQGEIFILTGTERQMNMYVLMDCNVQQHL